MKTQSVIAQYLAKLKSPTLTDSIPVTENLQIIIVIPCYNEPDILRTLESLSACNRPAVGIEIILFINAYQQSEESILNVNRTSYRESTAFASKHTDVNFKIIPLLAENLSGKQPGAGLPRKIAMDEALHRFQRIKKGSGIIVSLDADCLVDRNYLLEIGKAFRLQSLCSATIEFHHPVEHLEPDNRLRKAAELYELYIRYYRAALEYCGYPYAYYTIGSAMAVTALTYARAGGMGKQEAGEDFYFLQKVFPLGKTRLIDSTRVYPAARLSDRVPFGTGPELTKLIQEKDPVKLTYCLESFGLLKYLISDISSLYKAGVDETNEWLENAPTPLQEFLKEDCFTKTITEINQHTATAEAFQKRFFNYFNAFKILKYLNFVHPRYFEWSNVRVQHDLLGLRL